MGKCVAEGTHWQDIIGNDVKNLIYVSSDPPR